jgi:uncharacterized protein YbcI
MASEPKTFSSGASDPGVLAQISNEMVRLYKDQFGRGPTKVRTEFAGTDVVVCTLEDSLTSAERKMVEMGENQRLKDTRLYFQQATADDFRAAIEKTTGRKVRAFNSSTDPIADVSVEIFHLEPH